MADNIQIRDGNEDLTTIATEDVGGREFQLVKIGYGNAGSFSNISPTNALPVSGSFNLNILQPLTNTELRTSAIDVNVVNTLTLSGGQVNFPETIGVSASQNLPVSFSQILSATILNQKDVQEVSGTVNTNLIFPEVLSIQGTVGVSSIPTISATILNFPNIQAVSGNLSVDVSATDLQYNGTKVTNINPLPVSGNFGVAFPTTQGISGAVSASISNFPTTQNIIGVVGVSSVPVISATILNQKDVQAVSGNLSVNNFPQSISLSGNNLVSATILNFPSVQAVSGNLTVQSSATDIQYNGTKVTNANPLPVSGNFGVTFPTTQGISGTVSASISNFPTIQQVQGIVGVSGSHGVSGTVSATITNFPTTQTVNGLVGLSAAISASILNYPSSQNVNGIVGVSGTHGISGTVSASILNFPSVQAVSGNLSVQVSATDLQFDGSAVTSANPLPITGDVNATEQANLINYWPNTESIETETVNLNVDPSGALQIRGAITTDEGSYSTDFSGNNIYTILSGTCIFENGSTTVSGIGTNFLSVVSYGDFIKLSSDPLIDYTRIVTITSNTELELEYGYTGSSNSGSGYLAGFEQIVEGDASLSVSQSKLIINGGIQANSLAQVSRVVDFLPTAGILRNFSFSQNIPHTDCFFGFFDTHDYRTSEIAAYVIFLEAQTAQLVTRTSKNEYDVNTVVFSLPVHNYINTPARWKFEVTDDKVCIFYNDICLATSYNHIPPIYKPLNFNIGVFNKSIPESATILYLDEILFKNADVVNTASVLQSHVQMSYDSEANTILKELTSTMNSLQAALKSFASIMGMSVDINGRQRMNVETGIVAATISSGTVTTVTTTGTLTNQTNIGTYAANDMVPSNMNNSALQLRSNISVN